VAAMVLFQTVERETRERERLLFFSAPLFSFFLFCCVSLLSIVSVSSSFSNLLCPVFLPLSLRLVLSFSLFLFFNSSPLFPGAAGGYDLYFLAFLICVHLDRLSLAQDSYVCSFSFCWCFLLSAVRSSL